MIENMTLESYEVFPMTFDFSSFLLLQAASVLQLVKALMILLVVLQDGRLLGLWFVHMDVVNERRSDLCWVPRHTLL